ncbi:MAG: hypothetical protein Q7J23_04130 [Nitrosomonas sp.]|nr:hypothetical protein [Nitrosomonas sp.]
MKKLEAARQSHGRKRLELLCPSYCAGKEACNELPEWRYKWRYWLYCVRHGLVVINNGADPIILSTDQIGWLC